MRWAWGVGTIEITERALKFDAPGKHDSVALSEITAVERKGTWPLVALIVSHRGGKLTIGQLKPNTAKEITAALGF